MCYFLGLRGGWKQPDGDTERTKGFGHPEKQREEYPQILFLKGLHLMTFYLDGAKIEIPVE